MFFQLCRGNMVLFYAEAEFVTQAVNRDATACSINCSPSILSVMTGC